MSYYVLLKLYKHLSHIWLEVLLVLKNKRLNSKFYKYNIIFS